ncbi:UDP-N-acetylmuramoyl-L-alanyl-D-glutamate synthetase [Glycocaulis alkaliphilus]|uniref:UDP-N-acetylmuramoylalanine--D-glutamate ligase n=1 Tax=Glycocaulis alkaliphilus TaxID=1434191 RepID=A0A3T0E7C1_9PROT|nr:UDP-N-acetylmuramoyl-L-alanine--D-glutamate ligase [Glycocaulis alkaliphilus]AZU03209.1 UDP-N-acetylmuramoyl-L-alanyl-D-glutamate synthetase [Glycocaulis alkaliphilus]GGB71800.1 UDP-N-acetylmuramoylalanine--D-glutamate ligase [Glycocaulis alkaliphilus]
MIPVTAYKGRRVAVFGLGRTGITAARALAAGGAEVSAWDDNEAARENAAKAGLELDDLNRRDWGDMAALVLSPGIPLTHPAPHRMVSLARAVGAPVIGDVELFAQAIADTPGVTVIGITGTNGKSTTTALIGHILKSAGRDVRVGGNIGDAVLGLEPPRPGAIYVLELSSYQLDLIESLRCRVAVFLNLTPDHIDRHGDIEGYRTAKERIFANQQDGDTAIVGVDDEPSRSVCTRLKSKAGLNVIPVSSQRLVSFGVYALAGKLYDDTAKGGARTVMELHRAQALPGSHNAQNAAAAYAAVRALGVSITDAIAGIASFPGLPHRQERVGEAGSLLFINDSKATNAEAAAQALACYHDIFWIAGGQAKSGGVESLKPFFRRIRKAYLIGQDADLLRKQLGRDVPADMSGTLERALQNAAMDAAESGYRRPVILLSPACASFDQFRSYEHRGDTFRALVKDLLERAAKGDAA